MKNICVECELVKGKKNRAYKIYLCDTCGSLNKYKLICKTNVKNDYHITHDELEECKEFIVPRGGNYPSHRKYIKLLKSYLSFVHHKW